MPRSTNLILAATLILVVAIIAMSLFLIPERASPHSSQALPHTLAGSSGPVTEQVTTYPVTINKPDGTPRVKLAGIDPQGRIGEVACSTCHSVREPNLDNRTPETLNEFHQGLVVNHGKQACYACHHPTDSDALKLADGTKVAYQDVMTMCSQCHGAQATAFAHGAHGGMNGHWDLTRGPQTKNNCVDCHDPHSPAYPKMIVGFKPKDRFNAPTQHDSAGQHTDEQHTDGLHSGDSHDDH